MAETIVTTHEVECREQQLEKVVVFNDRAELKRLVKCELAPGMNEVHVKNVTPNVMYDSVRLDGRGDAIIHEVVLHDKPAIQEEIDSPKVADVRYKFEKQKNYICELNDRKSIIEKRIQVLDTIVGEVGSSVVAPPKENNSSFLLGDETLANLTKFFGYYDENSMAIRGDLREVQAKLKIAEQELQKLEDELSQLKMGVYNDGYTKSIIVTLESKEGGPVELDVIYQVRGANWRPSYDLRVETSGKQALKITYFGNVSQSTQEDWTNAPLVLSTAQPCLGGNIPELGTLEAVFFRPPPTPPMHPMMASRMMGGAGPEMHVKNFAFNATTEVAMARQPVLMDSIATSVSAPEHRELSTEFSIARPAVIPSDGGEHKVTIGIVDVSARLVHECVPSKNTSVFLTASAVNTSALPFLPGEAVVYLNNGFVTKIHLKSVSPSERFSCSLGVDTAIRVEYKPVKKYHEQVGIINKSSSTVHEQVISLKNTRGDPVLLTVKEHIPRATDEKIKIKMINPTVTPYDEVTAQSASDSPVAPHEGTKMTAANNLEWTIKMEGGQTQDLHIKWAVEHPKDEKIEFVERY